MIIDIVAGVLLITFAICLVTFMVGGMTIVFLDLKKTLKKDYGIDLTKKKNE